MPFHRFGWAATLGVRSPFCVGQKNWHLNLSIQVLQTGLLANEKHTQTTIYIEKERKESHDECIDSVSGTISHQPCRQGIAPCLIITVARPSCLGRRRWECLVFDHYHDPSIVARIEWYHNPYQGCFMDGHSFRFVPTNPHQWIVGFPTLPCRSH